jgi:undecaprenyl-diphosphatase
MMDQVHKFDLHLSEQIAGMRLSAWLRAFFKLFVRSGDGWIWLPVALGILVTRPAAEGLVIIFHCLIALGISLALYWPIKLSVRRVRPFRRVPGATTELPPLDQFSFPSGHIMNNLAIGLAVAHYFPPALGLVLVLPITWGLLRVLFRLHFLSDIVVGGCLGFCSFQISKLLVAGMHL